MTFRQSMGLKVRLIAVSMVVLVLVPYILWHEPMDAYFASPAFAAWIISARPYAWAVAIALLCSDVFLPIPATAVVAATGVIYGTFWGGLVAVAGLMLAGLAAYALARWAGQMAARLILREDEMAELQGFFGAWMGRTPCALTPIRVRPSLRWSGAIRP